MFLVTKVTDIYFMFTILAILFYSTMIKRLIKNSLFKLVLCQFVCGTALCIATFHLRQAVQYLWGFPAYGRVNTPDLSAHPSFPVLTGAGLSPPSPNCSSG